MSALRFVFRLLPLALFGGGCLTISFWFLQGCDLGPPSEAAIESTPRLEIVQGTEKEAEPVAEPFAEPLPLEPSPETSVPEEFASETQSSDATEPFAPELEPIPEPIPEPISEPVPEPATEPTPEKDPGQGTSIGPYWITYYYLAQEQQYTGTPDTDLYDANCKKIATVSSNYSDAVCIEGSGKLKDGRVINYAKTCSCGRSCRGGSIICYSVLDPARFPWGLGSRSNALVPLRSLATDPSLLPYGTLVYIPQWDGVLIPALDGLGGWTHDGCFRADDVGGAIKGQHYDFFAGTSAMWKALEKIHPTRTNLQLFKNPPRCAHLKP